MNNLEQTLSIIKPDAVERNLIEEIKSIFKENNLYNKEEVEKFILQRRAAEFYKCINQNLFITIYAYLASGPIVVMILEVYECSNCKQKINGITNPKDAEENTIRKLYGISIDKNSVHGSDSIENAKKEMNFLKD